MGSGAPANSKIFGFSEGFILFRNRNIYYQSRIKCPLFGGKKLKWSDDNKHFIRPHTILKNKKAKNANVPRFLHFLVWCGAVWGDRFIITPSEFFKEKGTFYSALVIPCRSIFGTIGKGV